MKAWISIGFYLSKDIWSRWLETPGAVLARLLVACLLAGLMLLTQAAFQLGARSLETRITRLGAQTLVVTEAVTGDVNRQADLGRLLAPLGNRADVVALRQASVAARDEYGTDYLVMVYGPESLPALAPLLAAGRDRAVHLVTPHLAAGLPVAVNLGGADHAALAVVVPAWLNRVSAGRPVALVPLELAAGWLDSGYFETALIVSRLAGTDALRGLAAGLRALLRLDDRPTAQVQSPEAILDEFDAFAALQTRAQTGAGLAGGIVVALVFGSIAILEYRQNRFIVALLRSFGAPAPLLLLRYAAEALLLVAVALLLVRQGIVLAHPALFALAGFEPGLLDRAVLDPYAWPAVWPQARWLLLGAALGVLPVAFALRQPVGKILQ